MSNYIFKQYSSLEKVFLNNLPDTRECLSASILKGEEFSYQIVCRSKYPTTDNNAEMELNVTINSPLKNLISIYIVGHVPSFLPAYCDNCDEHYIKTEPGLFPDILQPLKNEKIHVFNNMYTSLWISIATDNNTQSGQFPIEVIFSENDEIISKKVFTLEVINMALPEQKLIFTQWFHADCISSYYRIETFGEIHWQLIERFMKMASNHGINMILTPIFTPPLDTEVGGERPTVQLVDVIKKGDIYAFNFDKFKRWINIGLKNGIKYFEISHLFTQWGALATPKIEALVNGKKEKIFGWHTKSDSKEYSDFLTCFIPQLVKVINEMGISDNTFFHISDEPQIKDITSYKNAKDILQPLIKDFKIIDALSDFELYKLGIVENPISAIDKIEPFLEAKIPYLWGYNCCAQCSDNISNRFMAMPSYRNRIIGCQLYKYGISGFLHWGYNFYYTRYSKMCIEPFSVTDAGGAFPSGDAFSVYPATDGPVPSIRLKVFNEALQDMRAMQLLEHYTCKEEVCAILEADTRITFKDYPDTPNYILNVREKINQRLKDFVE